MIARLFAVQAAGALMILASAVPLATAVRDRLMAELLAPSSTAPLYERIATQLTREAFLVVVVVVVVELVTVYASRALLGHAYGLAARASRPGSSPGIVVRGVARAVLVKPARTLSNAALGWALFVGALLAGTALVGFAWQAVRAVFLAGSWSDRLEQAIALLGAAALLAACFAAALLALGLVSALRAALSSLASLR